MEPSLGQALSEFEGALIRFRGALSSDAVLSKWVLEGTESWSDLLTFKLVPHLAGQGCLVAAVTGGTNTGKSTVFNVLLGSNVSPIVTTAAATSHPVLAASEVRCAQCHEGKLVPEFQARPLRTPQEVTDKNAGADALFVTQVEGLPDHLVIMDTPDVDSIDQENWAVAEHIRAAGDILIAVITAEKYRDERVVRFFKEACLSGRVVIPVMNKANPADDFHVAREQIKVFRSDVGTDEPGFVLAHDFAIAEDFERSIESLDGAGTLRAYLETREVQPLKERVYRSTIAHFCQQAAIFVDRAGEAGGKLRSVLNQAEARAHACAQHYEPAPGPEVGGLFHGFVQSKRGPLRRAIGSTSAAVVRGAAAIGRRLGAALQKRSALEREQEETETALDEHHRRMLTALTQELATTYIETSRDIREPVGHLLAGAFETLDAEAVAQAVVEDTLRSGSLSDAFREHAQRTLETWWEDHKGRRRILEALDGLLAVMPAAIAAPIALSTGGVGVPEAVILAGPIAAQFATRVMEYQFGDAMFDFLSPWRAEQQALLEEALLAHLTRPCLDQVYTLLDTFEGEIMGDLKASLETCQTA